MANVAPHVRAALHHRTIDVGSLMREVESHAAGASVLFLGTVREHNGGRAVTGIDYSAYETMAVRELDAISREAASRFGTTGLVVEHRLGFLALGEASVAVAVSHERRAAAYDASRYVIEQLKRRVPVWKREHYADGSREWVNAVESATPVAATATGGVGAVASRPAPLRSEGTT